ncbi:argininosuccinate lyase [Saccharothrix longispora]|uniref:argininosuccinate lyase n=1 Tax=Saccharothrix longispora TaxID=33920 RepID=UPI0028FD0CBC|nr:argininosuccinate lyase [Saccharothrix longispora]MDU0294212.1 argininosuccinate lyase [Saccharothrix longispora]
MSGRLAGTLGPRTRQVVYGHADPEAIRAELALTTEVDLAHLVMLAENGLITAAAARDLVRYVTELRATGFAALHGVEQPRGLYLAYERHLSDVLGPDTGGRLHTGRSRNDLKATATAMRARSTALDLARETGRLLAVLLNRARAHRAVVMPVYTHFQAAMPVTYGYHLVGVAHALGRDLAALRDACAGLARCPLGAGAVSGTDLPIDPGRTAELLGFDGPPVHAVDAVASRDALLRVLAAASGIALTISRLAADLQVWSSAEFGFVTFPDRLVGGSSAMPQKRNAFLLEHLKAKAAIAVGAWTAAASATRAAPFTNSIEVGTEAVSAVWPGLTAVADAVAIAQVCVSGARPVPDRMVERAERGFVTATAVANRMVRDGTPFRAAHTAVGAAVRAAVDQGSTELTGLDVPVPGLDEVVAAHTAGGGPGAFAESFAEAHRQVEALCRWQWKWQAGLNAARARLAEAAGRLGGAP